MGSRVKAAITSLGGGELSYRTSPPPKGAKAQIFERCDLCTIGIGQSLHYENKQWIRFKHTFPKTYKYKKTFKYKGKRRYVELNVDEWCLESLKYAEEKRQLGKYLERCSVGFELD